MPISRHPNSRQSIIALLLLIPVLAAPGLAREVIPAPPVIDPVSVFAPDNAPDLGNRAPTLSPERRQDLEQQVMSIVGGQKIPYDMIGGDDLLIGYNDSYGSPSLDIADNGDIYAAVHRNDPTNGWEILVLRSTDEGEDFSPWGTLSDPASGGGFRFPYIDVVEGTVDAIYIVYRRDHAGVWGSDICMVNSPLDVGSASWSAEAVAMSQTGVYFGRPRFDSDVSSHPNFYLYVVAEGSDDTGIDIWFTRSTDHGTSFETPYMLATLGVDDRKYWYPDIAHGFGGFIHVAWYFSSDDGSFDSAVRYRRASNYANGGLADWGSWVSLTTTSDGFDDTIPRLEAGAASDKVVIAYHRNLDGPTPTFVDVSLLVSHDAGATFDPAYHWTAGPYLIGDIEDQPGTSNWMILALDESDPCLYTASESSLTSWSGPQSFQDYELTHHTVLRPDIALNPADGHRPAALWVYTGETSGDLHQLTFDADWKNDPGWPNLEPGFPMSVYSSIVTSPAVADLDKDGDLEIVFHGGSRISALHHDGSPVAGWPVDVAATLSAGPVAVGDLNGDGYPVVVVGATDGDAYAYDHEGNLLPGWPTTISGPGHEVFVSIGALGAPYPRTVVCVSSNLVRYRNHAGVMPAGAVGWSFGGGYEFIAPAAIGDIDQDGVSEVVGARHTAVFAAEMMAPALDFVTNTGTVSSEAPTLGDLDLDGDLEIFIPTESGILHVLDHTGVSVGAPFPLDTGDGYPLTSAVLAQIRGTTNPEIVFGAENSRVHAHYVDGTSLAGFPITVSPTFYTLRASPSIERIEGTSSDLVLNYWHLICAWDNYGAEIHGWPYFCDGTGYGSPAIADIDLDGALEVVAISVADLYVFDTNNPPNSANSTWPMYGHDSQRTGCSDCPEDVTTAVEPAPDGERITRVSFAAPSPNPVAGATQFSYAVPGRAVVSLEVFDLRGARVATVLREEAGPGRKIQTWDGRGDHGAPLASGHYFARLRVRGPGVNEELTRKLTILR